MSSENLDLGVEIRTKIVVKAGPKTWEESLGNESRVRAWLDCGLICVNELLEWPDAIDS